MFGKPTTNDNPFTLDSRVELHPHVVQREEGRRPLLGCERSRAFLEASEDAIVAVEELAAGGTLGEAEQRLKKETGVSFDLVAFTGILHERGFVRTIDGEPVEEVKQATERHPYLHAVQPHHVRWITHPNFVTLLGGIIATWVVALFLFPEARPHRADLLLFDRPGLNIIAVFGGLMFWAYLHELAHFFTARRYGLESTISASHRLYLLVLQTDVTNAWRLQPRQRAAIFMAGILFNLTVASLLGLSLLGSAFYGLYPTSWMPVVRYAMMLNVFPLIYQLFLFARTDLYHVVLVLTGERNLARDSTAFLAFRIRRAWRLLWRRGVESCDSCTRRVQEADPFCFGCGTAREGPQVPKLGFEYRSRRTLFAWGFVQILGSFFAFFMIFFLAMPFLLGIVFMAGYLIRSSWLAGQPLGVLEGIFAGGLVLLQLTFIATRGLKMLGWVLFAIGRSVLRLTVKAVARTFPAILVQTLSYDIVSAGYPILESRGLLPTQQKAAAKAAATAASPAPESGGTRATPAAARPEGGAA